MDGASSPSTRTEDRVLYPSVCANPATLRALRLARLDEVFSIHETLEGVAQARPVAVS